jgi:ubiquinone/menaquinone biosynthesis C-methylase UbiE
MTKRRQHSDFVYRLELSVIRLRDLIRPPAKVLLGNGVQPGVTVLDFGCGPGGFSLAAAQIVGPAGLVYALDIRRQALELVCRIAARRGLDNVRPLLANRLSEVPDESVDLVLLYDVLHIPPEPAAIRAILHSIHRVLKANGALSVSDHHLQEAPLLSAVTGGGLFRSVGRNRRIYRFEKTAAREATI